MMVREPSTGTRARAEFYGAVGSSGLRVSGQYVAADHNPRLNGPRAAKAFEEMVRNDAIIHGIDFAFTMLYRSVQWEAEPANESPEAARYAEWLRRALTETLETPWSDVAADFATKFRHGFAINEIVLKRLPDGTIGPRVLAPRAQETIYRWNFNAADGNTVEGLWQQVSGFPEVYLPRGKYLHTRTMADRGNPQGRSVFRGAYRYYNRKNAVEEGEGRAALRNAGLVVVRVPGEWFGRSASDDQKAMLATWKQMATELAEDRHGALVLPNTRDATGNFHYDLMYAVADGRRSSDMSAIIDRMDKRIAGSVLADFILLGQDGMGSYAMHEDKTDFFEVASTGFLDMDEAEVDRMLIRPLWRWNGFPEELRPRWRHRGIGRIGLSQFAEYIERMVGANILPQSEELSREVAQRARLTLPRKQKRQRRATEAVSDTTGAGEGGEET